MKKISAFITTGVGNVIPVLEAVDAAADTFPPLKSAASGALFILKAYNEFKSNQVDWDHFVQYITQAVACVSAAVSQSGNPASFDHALRGLTRTLNDILSEIEKEPERKATSGWIRKFLSFLKNRNKIPALETKLNRSLSNFNLGTTIDARNELAKTFNNTKELVEGVKVIASKGTSPHLAIVDLGLIGSVVKELDKNSTLQQLKCADGSSWNKQRMCQEGTRSDLLAKLEDFAFARDPSSPERVLLLTGVAGCGKTAIAQSLAERLSKQTWPSPRLGACFNFSAQVEDRRTSRLLFTTIAFALSVTDPTLEASIVDALTSDRTLASAALAAQFDGLVRLPLSTLPSSPPHPTVLILDALDEISDKDGLESLLNLLADDFSQLPPWCRVIITSRPDPTILHRLESASQHHVVRQQVEHKDSASLSDLHRVAHRRLREIATSRNLGPTWPEHDVEQRFVTKAAGLFVWVDVACKAIGKSAYPTKQLHRLLAGSDVGMGMNELYGKILDGCPWDHETSSNYHLVLGTVIALKTPLSASALSELVGSLLEADGEVEDVLEPLASVVLGISTLASQSSPTRPLEISHESFREFVITAVPEDKRKYAVDELESSRRLALPCLRVLNDELPLHAEMLQEFFPDTFEKRDIPSPGDGVVSETLGYACDHWMGHLSVVTALDLDLVSTLRLFLRTNLITWMKLCASRGQFHGVDILQTWLTQHRPDVGIDFMSDANLNDLAQCLKDVSGGLEYMRRLEEALVACQLWVAVERQLINSDPTRLPSALARCLNNLSNRLSELGRPGEALIAIEEAVRIRRALATERPAAFNPDLAMSLNNLSTCLSELGRPEEALVAIEEAARIYRQLATERPAAFNSNVAMSLNNLSMCLSGLGRPEEALVAIEEAARIYRQLATDRPAAFSSNLARSLGNLSKYLSELGRPGEALVAIEEAARIYRQLATDRPAAFNSNLAKSLGNLSKYLSELGRPGEALIAIEEAARIYRQLATERPAAFNRALATSLNNLSMYLSHLGRPGEALIAIEEAARIYRQLATERPAALNSDLAMSLNNLSNRLSELGRPGEALIAIEEAVRIRRALATERPAAFNPDLAMSLNNLSTCLSELGRPEEALVAIEEAARIHRQHATERPAAFNPVLAVSLNILSICLSDLGRPEEALGAIEEAVRIRRQLAIERPAAFNPALAGSLNNLAMYLSALGRPEEALIAIEEAARIHRQLAIERPAAFNPDLAMSLNNLSIRISELGRQEDALLAIEEAVGIYRQLATERPAAFNPNLATSLNNLSNRLSDLGRPEEALVATEESVALFRQLASEYPARFKAYLADALGRQAELLAATGREAEAELARAEREALM